MATRFELVVRGDPGSLAAAREALEVFPAVDALMSEWKPGSPLAAINRAAGGDPVAAPHELRAILNQNKHFGDVTGGAFDVTWAALWGPWNFRAPTPALPDPAEVARRAALVDYRRIEIDDVRGTVRLPAKGMAIGLGGIAKGWSLDRAAAVLRSRGVHDFLLSAGGQLLASGSRDGTPWRIGLRDPRGAPDDSFATLDISGGSVSTSGDYDSFFEIDGKRYHHILDPRTGWPTHGTRCAIVFAPDATMADALSKVAMVLGADKGLALLGRLPGVEAVVVDDKGKWTSTPGLAGRFTLLHPPHP